MPSSAPIGIFDSGVGGLTVADAVSRHLPNENIIYFGDTAHLPYGDKTPTNILKFCIDITDFLVKKNCKIIIIACNTASAISYEVLKKMQEQTTKIPIVDVISPVSEVAATDKEVKKIGIIATVRTIKTEVYPKTLLNINPNILTYPKATRSFAVMIEEGLFSNKKLIHSLIEHYFTTPDFANIDSLILGCTHYPLIKPDIQYFFKNHKDFKNRKIKIFDSTDCVALKVKDILTQKNMLNDGDKKTIHQCYLSDYSASFAQSSRVFFREELNIEEQKL